VPDISLIVRPRRTYIGYHDLVNHVELLFLGTGTSAGIPMIGCYCDVCTSPDPRDKRTRPSVLVSFANTKVLVDTTPELRLQCIANRVDSIDAIVYTHAHADHIMGLDDVRRFNALRNTALDVWADQRTFDTLQRCFGYAFREPDPSAKIFRPHLLDHLISGPFQIGPAKWIPIPLFHGEMPILGFRINNLAYCTDVSRIPDESFDLLRNLDVLVLDGLQFHTHPTHFSIPEAVEAAAKIGAKMTYLTHIAHGVHHETAGKRLPPIVALAYDGLRISIPTTVH
jgi:phosphoribosyl 1,2-cyclic phosphate phosphodiesterase